MTDTIDIVKEHIVDNVSHCANGPAIVWQDGKFSWCLYGHWHRYYGPTFSDDTIWVLHGQTIIKGNRFDL